MAKTQPDDSEAFAHLRQLDHWTFLVAFGLVSVNVFLNSRAVSAVAAALLAVAFCYDLWEFYR
jgi:hypothetical protein